MATVDKQVDKEQAVAPTVTVAGETWEWTGETCGNGSPVYTNGNARKTLVNGGLLNHGGNPTKSGGRKPERLRILATEGVEELLPKIIASTMKQADLAQTTEGSEARQAHAEAVRGFKGLVEAGPGTKVTNVVEKDGYHDAASRAYDIHLTQGSDKLSFLEALKRELDGIP